MLTIEPAVALVEPLAFPAELPSWALEIYVEFNDIIVLVVELPPKPLFDSAVPMSSCLQKLLMPVCNV